MVVDFRVVYIHGNGCMHWSSPWAVWLRKQLIDLKVPAIFETFPDSILARKQYWLTFLREYVKADERTILVGWSSGAVAAMRYAEQYKVLGSVLVSPCYTDLGMESERISGYFDDPWNWEAIRSNQKRIALVYSSNDEFIPAKEFEHIKEKLAPEIVHGFADRGHFLQEMEFQEVLDAVKQMLKL